MISALAIGFATGTGRAGTTRLVFTATLPLLGTWVGTVLAFYFARDNLDAATESTIQLTRTLTPQTPVRDVMIPASKIDAVRVTDDNAAKTTALSNIITTMTNAKRRRIPILENTGRVLYVLHDSTLDAYCLANGEDPSSTSKTLGDLLGDASAGAAVQAIGFVRGDAKVADARAAMQTIAGCNDVFVTYGGGSDDPMLGWLTNTDLAALKDAAAYKSHASRVSTQAPVRRTSAPAVSGWPGPRGRRHFRPLISLVAGHPPMSS